MSRSIDPLLSRRRSPGYDCSHFAAEAWEHETGENLADRLDGIFEEKRTARLSIARKFKRIKEPVSPCIVVMQPEKREPHVGVFIRGRVLHLRERAEFMPLDVARRGFSKVRFYQ